MDKTQKYWYRSRGLHAMEYRFGNNLIQKFIGKKILVKEEVNVLEIGFGEGKCLLDLRNKFPQQKVQFFGINNIKEGNMHSRKDFYKNAKKFGIKVSHLNLPIPNFYDVDNGLQFENNFFDVVISQVCIEYVWDKAKLLEEIWRVLKMDGRAFLQFDSENLKEDNPDFMNYYKDTPRMIIYNNSKIISSKKIFNQCYRKGYNIQLKTESKRGKSYIVVMKKNINKELNLNLDFDGNSTVSLSGLNSTDKYKTNSEVWWGTRSVFNVRQEEE